MILPLACLAFYFMAWFFFFTAVALGLDVLVVEAMYMLVMVAMVLLVHEAGSLAFASLDSDRAGRTYSGG